MSHTSNYLYNSSVESIGRNIRDAFELKLGKLTSKLQVLNVESLLATVGFQASSHTTQSDNGTTQDGSLNKGDIGAIQLSTRFIHNIYKLILEQKNNSNKS